MTEWVDYEHNPPEQLPLDGMGPRVGDRVRNRHSKDIGTIVEVRKRRYTWVTLRVNERHTDVRLDKFYEFWEPFTV